MFVRTHRFPRLLLAALFVVVLAACGKVGAGGDPTVAATVDGEPIPVSAVEERLAQAKAQPQVAEQLEASEGAADQLQAQIVSQLVLAEILEQWADELGVTATDADVAEQRAMLTEQLGGSEAFNQAVEQSGLSEAQVTEQLRQLVLQRKVSEEVGDAEVAEADIAAFYEENAATRFGEKAKARHILVEDEKLAKELKAKLDDGADFAKLAEKNSTDTGSAAQGGDLGEFGRGQMVPEFEEAVFSAKEGEIVGPVKTQFGFHVIQVTEKLPGAQLDEVRDEIRAELQQTKQQELLETQLMERTKETPVTVNPRFGTWDPATGQVTAGDPLGEVSESEPGAPGGAPGAPPPTGAPPTGAPPTGPPPTPEE